MVDVSKSIQELENDFWGSLPIESSGLIKSCYELREKKLSDLDENDLRIALSQNIGLSYVVSLAIEVLSGDPMLEALYYEGDLLKALVLIDKTYWESNLEHKSKVLNLVRYAKELLPEIDMDQALRNELNDFFNDFETS